MIVLLFCLMKFCCWCGLFVWFLMFVLSGWIWFMCGCVFWWLLVVIRVLVSLNWYRCWRLRFWCWSVCWMCWNCRVWLNVVCWNVMCVNMWFIWLILFGLSFCCVFVVRLSRCWLKVLIWLICRLCIVCLVRWFGMLNGCGRNDWCCCFWFGVGWCCFVV